MNYIKALVKDVNAYTLPQYLFVLFVYYLLLNSINNFVRLKMEIIVIPEKFMMLNKEVFIFIDDWVDVIPLLAISLIFSSMVFSLIKENPFFQRYNIIRGFATLIGTAIGVWLLLIWGIYWIYGKSQEWFFIIIFILALIIPACKEFKLPQKIMGVLKI